MIRKITTTIALACGLLGWTSPGVLAQSNPPKQIDLSKFPAAAVEDVVVPVPSEVFAALDRLGTPSWRDEFRDNLGKNTGNRAQVALLLGTVIAEGFVAVEAEDTEKVKEIGREVLKLSKAINVDKAVIERCNSITTKADAKDWQGVRREFDGALQNVRQAMRELNDDDIAQLVSLGGWLRGTEVLTSIVRKNYKPDGAELLHQPELLNYFKTRIDRMSPRLRRDDLVVKIRGTLIEIKPLINGDISAENVAKINDMTNALVISITSGES